MAFSDKSEIYFHILKRGTKQGIFEAQKSIIYGHISTNVTLLFSKIESLL